MEEVAVPERGFSVLQQNEVWLAALLKHVGLLQDRYRPQLDSAIQEYVGKTAYNLVRVHRFAEIPRSYDGYTRLEAVDGAESYPLVVVRRPPRPDLNQKVADFLHALDSFLMQDRDFFLPDRWQSPATVGFLEKVRRVGPHTELTILLAEQVGIGDDDSPDHRTEYQPKVEGSNFVRKVFWLESPLNAVFMVQGDVLDLQVRYPGAQKEVPRWRQQLQQSFRQLTEWFRHRGETTGATATLTELLQPLDPMVELDGQTRLALEELKRALVAEVLIKMELERQGKGRQSRPNSFRQALFRRVSREYRDRLGITWDITVNSGTDRERVSSVIASLRTGLETQHRQTERTKLQDAMERLQKLVDFRDSLVEPVAEQTRLGQAHVRLSDGVESGQNTAAPGADAADTDWMTRLQQGDD